MDRGREQETVEEMAASLVDSVVESIGGSSLAVTDEALRLLGVIDGEELILPDSFDDDSLDEEYFNKEYQKRHLKKDASTQKRPQGRWFQARSCTR